MNAAVAPKPGTGPVAHAGVAAPAPIPFRKTAIISGSEFAGLVVTTLLVLAVVAVLAWIARRQGWLSRWTGGAVLTGDAKRSMAVLEVLRISRKTTLYRIRNGNSEFVVAESSAPVQLAPIQGIAEQAP